MINKSLSLRLNLIIFFVVTAILFGFGYSDYVKQSKLRKESLQKKLEIVVDRLAATLKTPFWEYSYTTINSFVEAEMRDQNIYKILVLDKPANSVIVGKKREENGTVVDSHTPVRLNNMLIAASRDIVVKDHSIAEVKVYITYKHMYRDIQRGMIEMCVRVLVLVVLIAVTLVFFINLSVLKPIKALIKEFGIVASGRFDETIDTRRKDEVGQLAESFSVMRDAIREKIDFMNVEIHKRQAAEKEMRKLRNFQASIINSMSSAIIGVDREGIVTHWNIAAQNISGFSALEAKGQYFCDALPFFQAYKGDIMAHVKEGTFLSLQKLPFNSGFYPDMLSVDLSVYPLFYEEKTGAVLRIDDVTERVKMEELLVQNEKMLSVGGLAAGMAHEINNPLAGMLQNIQVIKQRTSTDLEKNDKVARQCGTTVEVIHDYMQQRGFYDMIDAIVESGRRASKIVENMLSFSRKSESKKIPVDMVSLVESTIDLAGNDYDLKRKYDFKQINIIREYQERLPKIACEYSKIQQVVLNILKNGAYAMAEKTEDASTFIVRLYADRSTMTLEIQDNGQGMEESVARRIFEPFYTTKGVSEGTGLGLSVSYFIVTENHGGTLNVRSEKGMGTVFILTLPLDG